MPRTFGYQWQRNTGTWADIAAAVSKNYTPVFADYSYPLRLAVTPSDGIVPAYSNATNPVTSALFNYLSTRANLIRYAPFDDASGVISRVVNPAVSVGRELAVNGGFDGGTISPFSGTNWAYNAASGGVARHTTGSTNALAATLLTVGKLYHAVFTTLNRTTGSVNGSGGASISTNTTTDYYFIATTANYNITPTTDFDGDIDNVSLKQVGVPASSAFPTTELVKDVSFDYENAAWPTATNWTVSGGKATHAAGSTTALTQTLSILIGRTYSCVVTVSGMTTGSITPRAGSTGTGGTAITANGTAAAQTLTCGGSAAFALVPSSDFDGSIDSVSLVPTDGLVVWNGDGSTTTGWTAANSATLSSVAGYLRVAYNAVANAGATQACMKIGSRYLLTITMRGDGTAVPSVLGSGTIVTGTSSTSDQTSTTDFIATSATLTLRNTTSSGYVEFDNISLVEIAPMSGSISGATLYQQGSTADEAGPSNSFDKVNDFVNEYSVDFNSAWSPATLTMGVFAQIDSAATWTDGTARYIMIRQVDANNLYYIRKSSANNTVQFNAVSGGITKTVNATFSSTGMHYFAMTISGGNMEAFIDGVSVGTGTGLGTWAGNLATTTTVAGALSTSGNQPWGGYIQHVHDIAEALLAAELLTIAQVGDTA